MAISNELSRKRKVKDNTNFFVRFFKFLLPWKGDKFAEVLRKFIFAASLVAFCVSGKMLYTYYNGTEAAADLKQRLTAVYNNDIPEDSVIVKPEPEMLDKFAALYEQNSDIVGWISINDTRIDYPVMQTGDNKFYLDHDFDKKTSAAGALFADKRGVISKDGTPDNTIIYGHNMKSGEFFHNLHDYKKLDFLKEHQTITYDTLYDESEWKIFACFITGIKESQDNGVLFDYHNRIYLNDKEEYQDFYDEVMLRNMYITDVDVEYGDEFLTLSTCSVEFYDSRFVVVARKVRDGEDAAVDITKTEKNLDAYYPIVWYEVSQQTPPR